ncbi:MAG: efflux RND transporter periplasmic adaptor subunit [Gammaproteobacteria bacterium]|nr:efflux RND transporter periplasmic adaptor subunit [Gammaproteobacteria bacterium]
MMTRHWPGLAATLILMQLSTVSLAASSKELSALGCMLQPSKIVEVSSPVSGVLEDVLVKRGDIVESGNILFRLKAGVQKAGVELARVKTDFAKRNVERNMDLYEDDLLSIHERDEIETELLLSQMELMVKEQELALRTVASPIDGVVVDRLQDEGEYVNVNPVVRLATLDPLHIDLLLPARYFGKIAAGQKLMISAAPAMSKARKANVKTVDPLIDPASGTFRVQLEMSNPGNRVPAGLRCVARTTR